jgi:hypothetical protein
VLGCILWCGVKEGKKKKKTRAFGLFVHEICMVVRFIWIRWALFELSVEVCLNKTN